jgi:outer membrane protein assembly factor BamD (BamD/ComL family)
LVSGGAVLYANRVKQTQEEIRTYYEESLMCLQAQKYLCACDGFRVLLATDSGMPNVLEYLNQAQLGLAQQYFYSGQWDDTVNELDDLLQRDPGNQEAVALLKISYDRWIDQLRLEGSWFKRWTVRKERDARFPPMDK